MNRRDFLRNLGLGATALAVPVSVGSSLLAFGEKSAGKPNVLFIAVDDLRPQISCYGHKQMISPNIDRIAADGVIFSRCYCQVPVCGASRAGILTGARPTRTRFYEWYSRADEDLPQALTLQKHFRNNGYYCISNGKVAHHAGDNGSDWSETPWRAKGGHYQLEESKKTAEKTKSRGPAYEGADVPDNAYPDGRIADKAIADLRRLNGMAGPFFLAVGFMKPHLPFNCPKKYWDLYKREEIDLADNPFRPKGAPDAALHNWGELRAYAGIPPKGPLADEMARTLIHGYYACVSYTDAQIGKVLNELERLGLRDNTIVVLWGDHGWNLGEHGLWCKHCNFETSLHSPLIMSAPNIKGGRKTDSLTEFVDIYPSLCELAGLPVPAHLEGKSLVPLMKSPELALKEAVFSRFHNGESVKTDRYRYTEWTQEDGKIYARMLYDHKADPMENVNISELPENKQLIGRLGGILRRELKRRAAHFPSVQAENKAK